MKINDVVLNKINSDLDFKMFLDELNIIGDTIIIKPNWVSCDEGSFTEAKVLKQILEYFKDKKLFVVESYTTGRNKNYFNGKEIFSKKETTLQEAKTYQQTLKIGDDWFFEHTGIQKLLNEYAAEYINITECVWNNTTTNAIDVKKIVAQKFDDLQFEEFYSYIPKKIFDLEGSTLISLSKMKTEVLPFGVSASTKNLFGLIPDPLRWKYHGINHELIPQSVLDINKIYRALFKTYFITEGIHTAVTNYVTNDCVVHNSKQIIGGKNSVEVDAIFAFINNVNYKDIPYLELAERVFGSFNNSIFGKIPKDKFKALK